jgi:hypothetical protein
VSSLFTEKFGGKIGNEVAIVHVFKVVVTSEKRPGL